MECHHKFKALERMLTDAMKEEQIKLGYQEETIRFYYPLTSLLKLLKQKDKEYNDEISDENDNGWKEDLKEFKAYVKPRLGEIRITGKDGRICFTIPQDGARYVKEMGDSEPFLREFIEGMRGGHCTLDEIITIFRKYSSHVVCRKIDQGEFDYVLYFEDGDVDEYRYCIKFERGHTTYHRFLPEDFEEICDTE